MREGKVKKIVLVIIPIILIMAFVGSISMRYNIYGNVVEAVNVVQTLEIMQGNSPINVLLKDEIKKVDEEKARVYLEKRIKEIQVERLAAEAKADVEQRIALELAKIEKAEKKALGKIAYLTFDDGPSLLVTPQILKILDEYDIKATFFVIGYMAERYPELLKKAYNEGHTIGNHTYSHNYAYIYKSPSNFINDLKRADDTLKSILGEEFSTNIMRFPGGSFGNHKVNTVRAVKNAGYLSFDWNSLNGDAEGISLSKERLVTRFKETVKNKKELIVLMHDTDAKSTTVESLREIIEYLIEEGYVFGVLDEYYN